MSLLFVNMSLLNDANRSFLNQNASTDAKAPDFTCTCVLQDRLTRNLERKREREGGRDRERKRGRSIHTCTAGLVSLGAWSYEGLMLDLFLQAQVFL